MPTIGEIGQTFIDNLASVVRGSQDGPISSDTFLTWCQPGIPFAPEDLEFAARGLNTGATVEEENALRNQAFAFSTLMDFIPEVGAAYDNAAQEGIFAAGAQARLSTLYREILRGSLVAHETLSEDQQGILAEQRAVLEKTVTETVDGNTTERVVPSDKVEAYELKWREYIAASAKFNAKKAAADAARGAEGLLPKAIFDAEKPLLELEVDIAKKSWAAEGFRNAVDNARRLIDQATARGMVAFKDSLINRFDKSVLPAPSGSEYPFTTLVPANVATAPGWTEFSMTHNYSNISEAESKTSWNASLKASWGLWGLKGGVDSERIERGKDVNTNDFSIKLQFAQAVIVRPWYYPEFFLSRGWTLEQGNGWDFDDLPSDGETPPTGLLVGYPTQVLLVRGVEIRSKEFVSEFDELSKSFEANGTGGWGPIRLKGGYSKEEHTTETTSTTDEASIKVDGMQIIGFLNHKLGKTPDPDPSIDSFI